MPTPQPAPMPKAGPSLPSASDLATGRRHRGALLLPPGISTQPPPRRFARSLGARVPHPHPWERRRISPRPLEKVSKGKRREWNGTGERRRQLAGWPRASPPDQAGDSCARKNRKGLRKVRVYSTTSLFG
jgi:hypothetical protein